MIFESALYSTGISLFALGVKIASPFKRKAALLRNGHKEIADRIRQKLKHGDRTIWIHAASLGEFEQARPLIDKIREELPQRKILLTFFSPSGYEVRKDYAKADCVTYLPFDMPGRVKKFLDLVNPEIAIFVKYEIWRNYLYELDRRQIPTYLISATFREDQKFFNRRYRTYGRWLDKFTRIFVQDVGSRNLLENIGITNVDVFGDTRFDRVSKVKESRKQIPEIEAFIKRGKPTLILIAGSSWPSDEEIYKAWIEGHPEVRLIIAPHEFDKKRLDGLKEKFGNGVVLHSELRQNSDLQEQSQPQVMVLDTFGLLSSAYGYADIAYVGGGFGAGLHNINEAAVYDIPVVYGPNNRKFIEAREMSECGGGIEIKSARQFEEAMEMLSDSAERKRRGNASGYYINSKLGATQKVFDKIFTP